MQISLFTSDECQRMEKFYEAAARDAESRSREDQLSTILGSTSVPHYEEPVKWRHPQ